MTDEELVKRLRNAKVTQDFRHTLEDEAADRIEALTEQLEEARTDAELNEAYAEGLETKLAKAVDTLMFYGGVMPNAFLPIQDGGEKARTTLAEIEGEKDA